jgi:required for meiotic nuclear division protein 1
MDSEASSTQTDNGLHELPVGTTPILARAVLIGERIDLRLLAESDTVRSHPLTMPFEEGGVAVVFRYGVIAFFGLDEAGQGRFLERIRPAIRNPMERTETEQLEIAVNHEAKDTVTWDRITITTANVARIQLIATALSKSVVLVHYEASIASTFERIEPLAVELQLSGRTSHDVRQLMRLIGRSLLSQQQMVGRVEIKDKPDLLWDHPELEPFYLRLEDELEIAERHSILERKLELASRTASTMLELIHTRQNLRLELYIVLLIIAEIVLFVYDLWG